MKSCLKVAIVLLAVPAVTGGAAEPVPHVEFAVPFTKDTFNLTQIKKVPGVVAAEAKGDSVKLRLDPYARVTLTALERAAGVSVDRRRLELPACVHLVMQAPCGGGGKAPCLETAHRGCFNAGPVTTALGKMEGVQKALLADMRPAGGDLGWLIVHADKPLRAQDVIETAQAANPKAIFRDLVLSGVFADDTVYIPSEFLPRLRPDAVKSAAPRLDWLHASKEALARARTENKMILLCAHHFD
ncbi:MAG: hypothetical protein AB7K24_31185 [Gemmataceae bacterium]